MNTRLAEKNTAPNARAETAGDPLMFQLIGVARDLQEKVEKALETVGLSWAKLAVLGPLARAREPISLSELAENIRCVRSNMTQVMDRLERDGLVTREDDATDRRIVRAALTAQGRELAAQGARIMTKIQSDFAASLSLRDRSSLERVLTSLR